MKKYSRIFCGRDVVGSEMAGELEYYHDEEERSPLLIQPIVRAMPLWAATDEAEPVCFGWGRQEVRFSGVLCGQLSKLCGIGLTSNTSLGPQGTLPVKCRMWLESAVRGVCVRRLTGWTLRH